MAVNTNVWRIANPVDLVDPVTASLSAQNTFTSAIAVAGVNRHIVLTVTGTWAGTLQLQRSTTGEGGTYEDVAGRTYTGNQSLVAYADGLSTDVWYRIGFKTAAYTSGTAVCTLQRVYSKQEGVAGRITLEQDSERGTVVKLLRVSGDAEVASGKRTEIARNFSGSERALSTGGGWYWTSYKLGPEWATAAASGALNYTEPPANSSSALIKQFAPDGGDGTYPVWCLRVSERGVSLHKNAIDDSSTVVAPKAEWPIDELWHDIVFGIIWATDMSGRFTCYLDGRLIYREEAPQMYPGSALGCYFKEGIYLPGDERDVAQLTIYTQGYTQGYPGTLYSDVVGDIPVNGRVASGARTAVTRDVVADRSVMVRSSSAVDLVI